MRKLRKRVIFVLLFLFVLEALYLGVGNWAVKRGALARLLSRRPERFQIEWSGGRTVWPGIFHLEGLRIRGQSEQTQTYVQVDRCTLRLHLFLLAACRVHFYRLEGEGFSLWIRHRREHGKACPLDPDEPPIPGLAQDAPPPQRKAFPSPWSLYFGSVKIAKVHEIWVGPYRTTGDGLAEGEASYHLRGPLTVHRSLLRLDGATTTVGKEIIASRVQADLDAAISSVVPRKHRGRSFLRYLSGRCRVRGQAGSMGFLNEALGKQSALTFKGQGMLTTDFTLDHGMLGPSSRITWEGQKLLASSAGFTAGGRGSLEGGTGAGDSAFKLTVRWSGIVLTREGLQPIPLGGPGLTATVTGPNLDLASDGGDLRVSLDLPESKIKDLSVLAPILPPKVPVTILPGSPALVRAHLEFQAQSATGNLSLGGDQVGIGVGNQTLRGPFYASVMVASGEINSRIFDISGTRVGFREAAFSKPGGPAKGRPWSGEALIASGTLHTTHPGDLKLRMEMKLTDTRPVVALFAGSHQPIRWFKGLLDVKGVTGSAGLAIKGTTAVIDDLDVRGAGLQMLGRIRVKAGFVDGAFYAKLHHLSAAVSIEKGKRAWKLINARKWYDALPQPDS